MEQRDVPLVANGVQEVAQGACALGKLEPTRRRASSTHQTQKKGEHDGLDTKKGEHNG